MRLSPGLWLVGTTKVYPGVGADIVMESISLIDPGQSKEGGFERNHDLSPSNVSDRFEKRQGSQHDLATVFFEDTQILPFA